MNTELTLTQMEYDFEYLANEHEATAENERLWSLGAPDPETAQMHIDNMEQHLMLARMYRRMKDDCLAFVETYEDDSNYLED